MGSNPISSTKIQKGESERTKKMLKALSSTVKSATLPQSDKGRVARDTSKIALPLSIISVIN